MHEHYNTFSGAGITDDGDAPASPVEQVLENLRAEVDRTLAEVERDSQRAANELAIAGKTLQDVLVSLSTAGVQPGSSAWASAPQPERAWSGGVPADFVADLGRALRRVSKTAKTLAINAGLEAHRAGTSGAGIRSIADALDQLAAETTVLQSTLPAALSRCATESLEPTEAAARSAADRGPTIDWGANTHSHELADCLERLRAAEHALEHQRGAAAIREAVESAVSLARRALTAEDSW
jgi:hypothetical protein